MRILHVLLLLLSLGNAQRTSGQATPPDERSGLIRGRLVVRGSREPAVDVQVSLPALKQLAHSDESGSYSFSRVPYGTYTLTIDGPHVEADTLRILVNEAVSELNDIAVTVLYTGELQPSSFLPTIAVEEGGVSAEEEGVRQSYISGLLGAGRDPFASASSFVFGPYRFQPRGYSRNAQEVQINGCPMNDLKTGDASWAQWGGLNDVFRSRASAYGLQPSEYAYGGAGGSVNLDAAPTSFARETRLSFSQTNRSYRSRVMLTHRSGILDGGWAYALSVSRRWATEGFVPGTFYDGYSYYAGIGRQLGKGRELNLVSFGAPTRRGRSAPVTREAVNIAGTPYYNPAWGYQGGKKRSARLGFQYQPVTILDYRYAPNASLRWHTSLAFVSGESRNSSLDYFNGRNPRPDYYRYLPSHYILTNDDSSDPDPGARAEFHIRQQVDWDRIYEENSINFDSIVDAAGMSGNTVRGRRSITVLFDDVDELSKWAFNSRIRKAFGEQVTLTAGIGAIWQRTESYRQLLDLLGGDFYLNLNQFAFGQNVPDRSFAQYDLETPDRPVREGDKYGYHYISRFDRYSLWAQGEFNWRRVDLFVAIRGGYAAFAREGLYRNGLFAADSYGQSADQGFACYGVKSGMTFKIDGRNYLFLNAGCGLDAPGFDQTFIAPRMRNSVVANATPEQTLALEGGYLMRAPLCKLRAVGYASDLREVAEIKRFYNDDPSFRGFVNYVMQGLSLRYTGVELAAELRALSAMTVTAVAAIGQAFYSRNPASVEVFRDNDTLSAAGSRRVYIRNYFLGVGPQSAYTLGLNYRGERYWYAGLNLSYFDRNYIDINPDQRTEEAVEGLAPGGPQYDLILQQESLPSFITVDLAAGKTWNLSRHLYRLPKNTLLYLQVGVSNLLNAVIQTGGFEQLRYDFEGKRPDKFAPKYFYGLGRNFFINLSLKM